MLTRLVILSVFYATAGNAAVRVMSLNVQNLNAPCASPSPDCRAKQHAYQVRIIRLARLIALAQPTYLLLVEVGGAETIADPEKQPGPS
jgi:hypothetical protein